MATVKDIARVAGVSPSTVSIVLGGKSKQRHISEETNAKVLEAARLLGYRPNIAAKRLRSEAPSAMRTVVAIYWASDFRTTMLSRFLKGVGEAFASCGVEAELVIHTYTVGRLREDEALNSGTAFHAAILGSITRKDLEYLESRTFPFPIVLYNRHSEKYPCVTIDDTELGRLAAEEFARRARSRAAIIASETRYAGMDITAGIDVRSNSFLKTCTEHGMGICSFQTVEDSMAGGYAACSALCTLSPMPDCIFCASDYIAYGALRKLHESRIAVPEQIDLIAVGNGSKQMEAFCWPSLSVVVVPMEEMAQEAVRLTVSLLEGKKAASRSVPVRFVGRESCPE